MHPAIVWLRKSDLAKLAIDAVQFMPCPAPKLYFPHQTCCIGSSKRVLLENRELIIGFEATHKTAWVWRVRYPSVKGSQVSITHLHSRSHEGDAITQKRRKITKDLNIILSTNDTRG